MSSTYTLYTVGHSTHTLEVLLGLLCKHSISVVADVRSAPYSRYCPHFNKDALTTSLKEHGIKYVFLGRGLGARTDDPSCYVNGQVQYSRLAERSEFKEAIDRVKKERGTTELHSYAQSESHSIAIALCSFPVPYTETA